MHGKPTLLAVLLHRNLRPTKLVVMLRRSHWQNLITTQSSQGLSLHTDIFKAQVRDERDFRRILVDHGHRTNGLGQLDREGLSY